MVFQDFAYIQERVNAEKKRKFRKKLMIASVSVLVVIAAAIGGAFAYVTVTKTEPEKSSGGSGKHVHKTPSSSSTDTQAQKHSRVEKIIKTMCNSTRYKESCAETLEKEVKKNKDLSEPKNLLKSAITAVNDDLDKTLDKVKSFKSNNQDEKDAIEHCKAVVGDAKEELIDSVNKVNDSDVQNFVKIMPDLNNWLSAVMSYQETCIDGLPDGKLKTDITKSLNSSQVLTSNSLAMVKSFDDYLSSVSKLLPGKSRRLLTTKSSVSDNSNEFPSWLSHDDRRILKAVDIKELKPNAIVAKDGSGKFSTINDALKAMPAKYEGRYIIYIQKGIYDEIVTIDKKKANVTLVGDGSQKTIVTGNRSFAKNYTTFTTATFVAQGEGFMAQSIGFRNTAGPEGHQAVAIRVQSDRAVFMNCRFEGYQDTLYAYTHRQYYRSCVIVGTIDFIFGDASAVFQNCNIFIRKGLKGQQNAVTAQGRVDPFETTGFVLQNCTITADVDLKPVKGEYKSYLGRPWKSYSRTVVMESTIEDVIDPAGWLKWEGAESSINTLYYAEFQNDGASGGTGSRVKWPGFKVINKEEALEYTVGPFLQGDDWIKATGAPVKFGLFDS